MALPPGPRIPAVIMGLLYLRDPIGSVRRGAERWGPVHTARMPSLGQFVVVGDPDLVRQVFTQPEVWEAGKANQPLTPVLGPNSVLTLDGPRHMRERKLLLPPFHGDAVARYREIVAEIADAEIDRWPVGRPFALRPHTQALTLEVILRVVFGIRERERLERLRELIPRIAETSGPIIWLPALRRNLGRWSPWARFRRVMDEVDTILYDEIARRRRDPGLQDLDDIMSLLLQARDEDGKPMTDGELRDELMTLLGAGHETTATALAWVFERLLRHPPALARLTAEIEDGEGDEYLNAVITETLRVRPVVIDVGRVAARETELGGYTLPAGTMVVPSIPLIHMREDLYPEPERFRPERFLGEKPSTYGWIPFGGGIRRCIGASFAQMEMQVAISRILSRVDLRPAGPRDERVRLQHITFVPSQGAQVIVDRRHPSPAAPHPARPPIAA